MPAANAGPKRWRLAAPPEGLIGDGFIEASASALSGRLLGDVGENASRGRVAGEVQIFLLVEVKRRRQGLENLGTRQQLIRLVCFLDALPGHGRTDRIRDAPGFESLVGRIADSKLGVAQALHQLRVCLLDDEFRLSRLGRWRWRRRQRPECELLPPGEQGQETVQKRQLIGMQ
jgi:hypothetical protein